MRLFPGRHFRAVDCSGIVQVGSGVTGQIATLRPMYGFRFLRVTAVTLSNNRSGGTLTNSTLLCTVPGLARLLDNLPFPVLLDAWRIPLMHEIDASDQGTFSIVGSGGSFNYAFRLEGFYHNGDQEEEDPDIWRPSPRSMPFNVSGRTAAFIGNGNEGSVVTFETPNSGRGVRIFAAQIQVTAAAVGKFRFVGDGFEDYRDAVFPVYMGSTSNTGLVSPMLAVLPPRKQYDVRYAHTAVVGAANVAIALHGWTLP